MKINPIARKQTTLAEMAYEQIYNSIIKLEFLPGQMIYETEVAEMLQVSRTPVREAIMLLKSQGMVDILPQKGIRVSLISRKRLQNSSFVRISLEKSALDELLERWDPDSPVFQAVAAQARAEIEKQQAALDAQDGFAFLKADAKFHKVLIQVLQNEILNEMYKSVCDYLDRARYLEVMEDSHRIKVIKLHGELLEAILQKDKARMNEAFLKHANRCQVDPLLLDKFADYFTE